MQANKIKFTKELSSDVDFKNLKKYNILDWR